jgi:GGDEF domain-containing protein
VYADGNAIGRLVKQIQTTDQFRFFSQTVDSSIREACHEALHENCPEVDSKIPADILLLGGDDLLVYLSAETALPFAISAARKFNEKTRDRFGDPGKDPFFKEILQNQGLSVSIGISYGRSHTPFSILLDQAEELLASAKKAGSERADEGFCSPTFIDYHVSVHFNQLRVADSRRNHLTIKGEQPLLLYQKPYLLKDAEMLLEYARNLVSQKTPRSRLKRLGCTPSLGKVGGMIECMKVFARTRDEQQRMAIWKALDHFGCSGSMPWRDGLDHDDTVLVDLMELTEFVGG